MSSNRRNPPFLNGVPELLVLRLLAQRPRYGYELVKTIQVASQQALAFGEGCIYPYLHYLEQERLVRARQEEVAGRQRTYYSLTPRGVRRLEQLTAAWHRVTLGVTLVLEEEHA